MKKGKRWVWMFAVLLAAGPAMGQDEERRAPRVDAQESAAPGWMERNISRLERAIARLEARISERGGSMTGGCEDMMSGGGMMRDQRPNERWRSPGETR